MQDKQVRQKLILDMVENSPVKTQSELKSLLSESGVTVNQATLSRDIKELGLYKTTIDGELRYVGQENAETKTATTTKPISRLSRFVQTVDHSGNIIVLKTDSGAANHVAEYLDNSELDEILGTIAGDNNIFIVVRESASITDFKNKLKSLFSL